MTITYIYFFAVWNPEKSLALIGCWPVLFFTIRSAHAHTAHVSVTIEIRFFSQIKLKTNYNSEHFVEVFKMKANFHVQSVTGVWMFYVFIARVIRKSSNTRYRARSVSVVNQKLPLSKFQGKHVFYRSWSVRIEKQFALSIECTDLGLRSPSVHWRPWERFSPYGPPVR